MSERTDSVVKESDEAVALWVILYILGVVGAILAIIAWVYWFRGYA